MTAITVDYLKKSGLKVGVCVSGGLDSKTLSLIHI